MPAPSFLIGRAPEVPASFVVESLGTIVQLVCERPLEVPDGLPIELLESRASRRARSRGARLSALLPPAHAGARPLPWCRWPRWPRCDDRRADGDARPARDQCGVHAPRGTRAWARAPAPCICEQRDLSRRGDAVPPRQRCEHARTTALPTKRLSQADRHRVLVAAPRLQEPPWSGEACGDPCTGHRLPRRDKPSSGSRSRSSRVCGWTIRNSLPSPARLPYWSGGRPPSAHVRPRDSRPVSPTTLRGCAENVMSQPGPVGCE